MAKNITAGEDRKVPVYDAEGAKTKATVVLPASIFDVALNIPLIHQVVEAQRAAARAHQLLWTEGGRRHAPVRV